MTEEQTGRLIAKLADDLTPVRRAPRLRSIASLVLGVWGMVLVYSLMTYGARPDWWVLVTQDATYLAVLLGLAACGIGATLASLASAIPGREVVAQRGIVAAALGLSAAAAVGMLSLTASGSFAGALADDWMCLQGAVELSPLPVAAGLFAVSRGWVGRVGLTVLAALAGAAAAGALGVHLTCSLSGARHFLLGHAAAPLVLALVLALPAAALLRRFAR